jgi:hypothetical protein
VSRPERSTTRQLVRAGLPCCLLALLPTIATAAVELPIRKTGPREMKVLRAGALHPR